MAYGPIGYSVAGPSHDCDVSPYGCHIRHPQTRVAPGALRGDGQVTIQLPHRPTRTARFWRRAGAVAKKIRLFRGGNQKIAVRSQQTQFEVAPAVFSVAIVPSAAMRCSTGGPGGQGTSPRQSRIARRPPGRNTRRISARTAEESSSSCQGFARNATWQARSAMPV